MLPVAVAVFLIIFITAVNSISIDKFGALPDSYTIADCEKNSEALRNAFQSANASTTDRTVEVPDLHSYCFLQLTVDGLRDVTFTVRGRLAFLNDVSYWNKTYRGKRECIKFNRADGLTLNGHGTIDGLGYKWWKHTFVTHEDFRPRLLVIQDSVNVLVTNITLLDSPSWNLKLSSVKNVIVRAIRIFTHLTERRMNGFPKLASIPIFPLNTDGIDITGRDVLVDDVDITCYDDVVVPKPSNKGSPYECTQNITIRNVRATFGVGLTIGSVPPNTKTNCVRNVTFENAVLYRPLKGIYVKSNPGDHGDGIIENILYRNITIHNTLWEPIWIGPQQQRQPGTKGTGCSFLYPTFEQCPTQPRVSMKNIRLEDITLKGSLLYSGVILCNSTNPCDVSLKNVQHSGPRVLQRKYLCRNARVSQTNVSPAVECENSFDDSPVLHKHSSAVRIVSPGHLLFVFAIILRSYG